MTSYQESVPLSQLVPMPGNPRRNEPAIGPVAESIKRFGWTNPILARRSDNVVVAGHTRLEAAKKLGLKSAPVIWLDLDETSSKLYNLADNKLAQLAEWDTGPLAEMLRALQAEDAAGLLVAGFGQEEINAILAEATASADGAAREQASRTLAERFGVPPFSVLNAREGWWQDRKRAWVGLGIQSEIGRGGNDVERGGGRAANAIPGGSLMPADRAGWYRDA